MTDAELTRLAAEKVMGWHSLTASGIDWWVPARVSHNGWQPLTDWRAAGEILDALADRNYNYTIECSGGLQRVYIENNRAEAEGYGEEHFDGNNAPRAIVMAALRAVDAVEAMEEAEKLGA